jgi:hypothetical protein
VRITSHSADDPTGVGRTLPTTPYLGSVSFLGALLWGGDNASTWRLSPHDRNGVPHRYCGQAAIHKCQIAMQPGMSWD